MSYVVDKGIPHSEFLGWSPEDRAKTIAFISEQALSCTMCGTADWEWEENKHAYAPEEKFCQGCYLKSLASEDAGKLPGTTVTLVPVNDLWRRNQARLRERTAKMDKRENIQDSE